MVTQAQIPLQAAEEPSFASRSESLWKVVRTDDNGNHFTIADHLSSAAAEAMVRHFEELGHKQTYWASPVSEPSSSQARPQPPC